MEEFIRQFLDYLLIEKGLSKNTIQSYGTDLKKFKSYLGSKGIKNPRDVKKNNISKYLYFLKDKGLSAGSISRNLVAIKMLFRFLMSERVIKEDVASMFESPRLLQGLPEVMNMAEVVKILESPNKKNVLGARDTAALELMYATGMRVSEIAGLLLENLNMDVGFIRCVGKGGKERIVPVGRKAKLALERYLKKSRPKLLKRSQDRHLFLSRLSKKISRQSFWKMIKKYENIRKKHLISIKIRNKGFAFSPGKHNKLQKDIMEQFAPQFTGKSIVVYVGDTAHKQLYLDQELCGNLRIDISRHDKLPDVVLYNPDKNWVYLIEAVTTHGPMSHKRVIEINEMLKDSPVKLIFVSAFPDFRTFIKYASKIAWETEVWLSDNPEHMIHFNGDKFLGSAH